MMIREQNFHSVMTGLSMPTLRENARRNRLIVMNNGASPVHVAFGHDAVNDDTCFEVAASTVWVLGAQECPRSAMHLIGTAGDTVVVLESTGNANE